MGQKQNIQNIQKYKISRNSEQDWKECKLIGSKLGTEKTSTTEKQQPKQQTKPSATSNPFYKTRNIKRV